MSAPLCIAVASGKGGTGKTTIATNLAFLLADAEIPTAYVDCDVEEPNGHLFLGPVIEHSKPVSMLVPEVDETRCELCGACGKACRFSAILALPNKILTFPKLCHSCGGCLLACSAGALREVPRRTGVVEQGHADLLEFVAGKLDVGEAMAPPVIRAVLENLPRDRTLIIDAPPGTACPVIEAVKPADVVLLVAEPTPFGLNDLKLAVAMMRQLGTAFGVAINRADSGDGAVLDYCRHEEIPVVLELPHDRRIYQAYSRGKLAVRELPALKPLILRMYEQLQTIAQQRPRARVQPRPAPMAKAEARETYPSAEQPPAGSRACDEVVVISGKGGTGKTSILAALATLAKGASIADCDVDAADLHLVLEPQVRSSWPFSAGKTATIDAECCAGCGLCSDRCRFDAISLLSDGPRAVYEVDAVSCEGCGVCADVCPEGAATLVSALNGEWFVSETRHGPMVHARLGIAEDNSGKLVSLVRREAKALARLAGCELLLCDGPPGIGCPVIASITGADLALVVTEPTVSGLHDFRRVIELCRQLEVNAAVCINKADINEEIASTIAAEAARHDVPLLGTIRYDESITTAQVQRRSVIEHGMGPAAQDIRALWDRVQQALGSGAA
jgi:MinD superfamily P-loop ATPase